MRAAVVSASLLHSQTHSGSSLSTPGGSGRGAASRARRALVCTAKKGRSSGSGTAAKQHKAAPQQAAAPGSLARLGGGQLDQLIAELVTLRDAGQPSSAAADGSEEPGELVVMRQEDCMDAVVKVFCNHTEPNFSLPWQRKRQYSSTSSGFVVAAAAGGDGGQGGQQQHYLLTNAHSVEYNSQVKVKKRGDDSKYVARVLAIATEADIALLTVDDQQFWEGVQPLRFGPLPNLQESVYVIGYPIGGDTISVTSGVVSRIEVTAYAHGATELLAVQIDAAINSGNSGGPVFNELGEVVGIAFQSFAGSDAENIGYVIPTPVVRHFLEDFKRNGCFTGFPALGVQWQRMESAALREHFKMGDEKGVLVRNVQPTSYAHGQLLPGDILMAFDGVHVANDGTVPYLSGERIAFSYLTSLKFTGDVASIDILRDGEPKRLEIKLWRPSSLVPHHLAGGDPSFFVFAGLVFTTVTEPFLESEYGADYGREAPIKLLDKLLHSWKAYDDQQVVVVSQVLAHAATLGYEEIVNTQVLKVDGQPVRNLRGLVAAVEGSQGRFITLDLEYDQLIVLDREQAHAATAELLKQHGIPQDRSDDLRAVAAAQA